MKTLTVDAEQRVRLPDVKPFTELAYETRSDGTILLTELGAKQPAAFPRGSLIQYLTAERDEEQLNVLKGCIPGPE